jgi:hypothetical protein
MTLINVDTEIKEYRGAPTFGPVGANETQTIPWRASLMRALAERVTLA